MKRNSRRASPATCCALIAARQVYPSAKSDDMATKLYSAFEGLKAGTTDDDLFDRLALTLNAALIRAESIDELCFSPLQAAADAMRRCELICARHGRYGFDGPGLQAMAAGLEVCEEIIRNSSPKQKSEAFVESLNRVNLNVAQADHQTCSPDLPRTALELVGIFGRGAHE